MVRQKAQEPDCGSCAFLFENFKRSTCKISQDWFRLVLAFLYCFFPPTPWLMPPTTSSFSMLVATFLTLAFSLPNLKLTRKATPFCRPTQVLQPV